MEAACHQLGKQGLEDICQEEQSKASQGTRSIGVEAMSIAAGCLPFLEAAAEQRQHQQGSKNAIRRFCVSHMHV